MRRELYAYLFCEIRCVTTLHDGASTWLDRRPQWKPSITLATGEEYRTCALGACVTVAVVLSVIQEKVNNPSADDPFEPEIAAVSGRRRES